MPRKIKVEHLADMPDSEGRTVVVEEIKSEEQQVATEPKVEATEAPKPKAKARGRSKKVDDKSALADSLTQIVSSAVADCLPPCGLVDDAIEDKPKKVRAKKVKEVEPEPEPMKEEEKPKKDDKVVCPDCGRKVSAKTLKYTHKNNCKAFKEQQQPQQQLPHSAVVYQEDTLEEKMQRRREQRLQQKDERIQSLIAEAF